MIERPRVRRDWADDSGGAIVEFLGVTLLVLIPVVYLLLALARVQAGSVALDAAVRDAARAVVVAGVEAVETGSSTSDAMAVGEARARASTEVVLANFGFDADTDAGLEVTCSSGGCLEPGSDVDVDGVLVVSLPGVPDLIGSWIPLEVTLTASGSSPVDGFEEEP